MIVYWHFTNLGFLFECLFQVVSVSSNLNSGFSLSLCFFQSTLGQTEGHARGQTVGGAASVCCWSRRAGQSVCARRSVDPPLCRCAAPMEGSTRTTVRCTAPPACRRDGSTWCTARTASSKVEPHHQTVMLLLLNMLMFWYQTSQIEKIPFCLMNQRNSKTRSWGIITSTHCNWVINKTFSRSCANYVSWGHRIAS